MDRLKKLTKELVPRSYIKKEKDVLTEITNSSRYTKKLVDKLNKILENKDELTEEDYKKAEDEVMK